MQSHTPSILKTYVEIPTGCIEKSVRISGGANFLRFSSFSSTSFSQLCSDLFASHLDSAPIRQLRHTWRLFAVITSPRWTINAFSTNDTHFNNSCLASAATIGYVRLRCLYHNDRLGVCITGYDRLSIYIGISTDSASVYEVSTSVKMVM